MFLFKQVFVSSFNDYWRLGDGKGVANSDDILRWFNQQLVGAGLPAWKRRCRKWDYVRWKLDIPNSKVKMWITI